MTDINIGGKYIGWSTNSSVRMNGGSGGLVTAIFAAALHSGLVDKVVILKKINQFEAIQTITDDVNEVLNSAGSMHMFVSNQTKYIRIFNNSLKLAISLKPCDMRGIIEQSKRNTIDLDKLFTVGVNCGGTMLPEKMKEVIENIYNLNPENVCGEEIEKGKLIIETKDKQKHEKSIDELEIDDNGRRENCRYCTTKIAKNVDLSCGNWGVPKELSNLGTFVEVNTEKGVFYLKNAIDNGFVEVTPVDSKNQDIRTKINNVMIKMGDSQKKKIIKNIESNHLNYYISNFKNCIHCNACKSVCPVCACDKDAKCTEYSDILDSYPISIYQLTRFLHLSDSCIGCGHCTDVCPSDIPLTNLYRRFANKIQDKLKYIPGIDTKKPPFFANKLEEIE